MKITFLGTAAAEGFPAVFCNCEYCKEARQSGGKNIRTRSQTLIDDKLLIDLPADTYSHFLHNGIEGDTIRYLLVTHSHSDHFYPNELFMRQDVYAHNMRAPSLQVVCGTGAKEKMASVQNLLPQDLDVRVLSPFESVTLGNYTVTALPARHMEGDGALFYIIQGDKTLLYAHDTGFFFDEVFDFLKDQQVVFDAVSLDCTNIDIPITDEGTHMGLPNIQRLITKLSSIGAVTDKTLKIINHFSHNGNPLHEVLEERVKELCYEVAFDGKVVEI